MSVEFGTPRYFFTSIGEEFMPFKGGLEKETPKFIGGEIRTEGGNYKSRSSFVLRDVGLVSSGLSLENRKYTLWVAIRGNDNSLRRPVPNVAVARIGGVMLMSEVTASPILAGQESLVTVGKYTNWINEAGETKHFEPDFDPEIFKDAINLRFMDLPPDRRS